MSLMEVTRQAFFFRSPAKAGAHPSTVAGAEKWVPAFAGKREDMRYVGRPKSMSV
jgi:hypothetical protein